MSAIRGSLNTISVVRVIYSMLTLANSRHMLRFES